VPDAPRALLAAGRRFAGLLGVLVALTVGVSLLAGLALGESAARSVATGLYVAGCFLLVVGVLAGIRGPVRPKGEEEDRPSVGGLFGIGVFAQGMRKASADERRDASSTSWLFLSLGIALLVLGIAVDARTDLL
jgi:uncharacterized membrane protein HdeD (DUF308 family)